MKHVPLNTGQHCVYAVSTAQLANKAVNLAHVLGNDQPGVDTNSAAP